MPASKPDIDELELAEHIARGETTVRVAERMGLTQSLVARRVKKWRRDVVEQVDREKAYFWLREASPGQVAWRWLFHNHPDPERWAPRGDEDVELPSHEA